MVMRVNLDGETHRVDSLEEAQELVEEHREDELIGETERIVIEVEYTEVGWVASLEEPEMEYQGQDPNRKWGAVRDLAEFVDERARRFGC